MVVSLKWLAHAGFQIKAEGKIIYVDLEQNCEIPEKADIILVTHSHTDHCDPTKIEQARKADTIVIAPADCKTKISGTIESLKAGEEKKIDSVTIKAVEAYNVKRLRSPGNPFHPKGLGVGYLITVEGKTIYHAGDSDFIPEMKQLGPVDIALLPTGDTYTMDNIDAAEAAMALNPKIAIPMHRWDTDPVALKQKIEAESNIKVIILKQGEEYWQILR